MRVGYLHHRVLVAGTAAAVINTQALDSEASSPGVPVVTAPTSLDTTTSTTVLSVPDTTVTTVATTPAVTATPISTATQQTFSLGRAGVGDAGRER